MKILNIEILIHSKKNRYSQKLTLCNGLDDTLMDASSDDDQIRKASDQAKDSDEAMDTAVLVPALDQDEISSDQPEQLIRNQG